ncbi:MAG: RidA family protein [Christensenellales bacterium]|jgi:2-iminobutanoate/2-iminopropanoate deaminase
MQEKITTTNAPLPAGLYSQAIVTDTYVFVAGQGPQNASTGKLPESVGGQTRQVLNNIKNILEAAGSNMQKVVKVSAFLNDMKDFKLFNEAYNEFFTDPYPVRTTIGAQLSGILVEIDVVALV